MKINEIYNLFELWRELPQHKKWVNAGDVLPGDIIYWANGDVMSPVEEIIKRTPKGVYIKFKGYNSGMFFGKRTLLPFIKNDKIENDKRKFYSSTYGDPISSDIKKD